MPQTIPTSLSRRLTLSALLAAIIAPSRGEAQHAHGHSEMPAPQGFAAEMAAAMARMHQAMQIAPEGKPARDFARMMIAHHQGAVDMALVLQRWSAVPNGAPSPMLRLAQEIVVEQRAEIEVMEQFLRDSA
jgi:uncharacterized protein (DUF305 family)